MPYQPEIIFGEADLSHAFSRVRERHEGIVAAKQNLRGGDKTGECRNRRSIGSASDVVIKAFQFVLDSVWCFLSDVLRAVLVHTTQQHGNISSRVRKDEANVREFCKGTCKKQICDSAGGILRNLNEYW